MTATDPIARTSLVIANFMDSSLQDLAEKGVFENAHAIYNPQHAYARVLHFSPHRRDTALAPALEAHGIEIVIHDAAGLSPLKIVRAIARVWKLIGTEDIDLVRGRLPYLGSLIGGIAAWLRRRPFVVSLGGDNRIVQERNGQYNYGSRCVSYTMENLVLRMADAIIVPNRYTARYVARIIGESAAERRCIRIPWISVSEQTVDQDPAIDEALYPSQPTVLIVGFLNRYKYTDTLFDFLEEALRDATSPASTARYVFCGAGALLDVGIERFANHPQVVFLGWTPHARVKSLMASADIVLVPMSGFVLLEAAELGRPVITSNVEWHGELVEDGESGLLVAPQNPSAWQHAVDRLLSHPEEGRAMGEKLQSRFEAEYTPERCAAAEVALYHRLTERSRR